MLTLWIHCLTFGTVRCFLPGPGSDFSGWHSSEAELMSSGILTLFLRLINCRVSFHLYYTGDRCWAFHFHSINGARLYFQRANSVVWGVVEKGRRSLSFHLCLKQLDLKQKKMKRFGKITYNWWYYVQGLKSKTQHFPFWVRLVRSKLERGPLENTQNKTKVFQSDPSSGSLWHEAFTPAALL